jgi:regulator of ribonuclease activity A
MTPFKTPNLCDRYGEIHHLQIAEPLFRAFGGKPAFCGRVTTLKIFEDNVLIRATLEEKTEDGVLVIDGGGSHRCALLGGNLSRLAVDNGWQGIVVYGCIRDSLEVNALPIGIRALHTHPLKSHKRGHGDRDKLITFAGVNFRSGYYLYADEDGIVVAEEKLV